MKARSFIIVLLAPLVLSSYDSASTNTEGVNSGGDTEQDSVSESIQSLPNFEVQLLYEAPLEEQGSWVSLAVGPRGDLFASDENQKGTYRIRIDDTTGNAEVQVEEVQMPATGAQGLTWAFDHLYANMHRKGLFRMRDRQGDGHLNIMEYLGGPTEQGDHGNHAVLPTEDGDGLYVVNGNHTPPPELTSSRLSGWEEDILLSRQWDARGHARGVFAPGGYIARINPGATEWEMISIGHRNTYDAAINPHGELFTYDADMEWDMGMPWYRPTRIVHAVSGSDYGWRSGSGKWKQYYEDSLPPVLNIGPGSPTGLLFGTGAQFPARYQRALFGLDWTFGTMYAFHLEPKGASYTATAEEFLSGSPLPLTDAVIGKDGALYFITGGWDNKTKLYRVIYTGDKSTAPVDAIDNPKARAARQERQKLEAFHGKRDRRAVEVAWPYLADEDRFLRHAARVAIESQPVQWWVDKALTAERPQARITGLVALARTAPEHYREEAIASLLNLELASLDTRQQLGYLRAMALVCMRLGDPDEQERSEITDTLQELLPANDDRVNVELVRLLVYLQDERVIEKALALMQQQEKPTLPDWSELVARNEHYGGTIQQMLDDPPPTNKLEYAFMLRNLQSGWTIEQRREYFAFINNAADAMGGASYTGFLERMRNEALQNASEAERKAVADIAGVNLSQEPDFEISPPEGPGRNWTVEEATEVVSDGFRNRDNLDFEKGRNAFFATGCASCHRFAGYGGNIGPDLSTVGQRFSTEKMLNAIIRPSDVISSLYNTTQVTLTNGEIVTGLVVDQQDSIKVYSRDPNQAADVFAAREVASMEPVDISQMPPDLINPLNAAELQSLAAYLISGGDPGSEIFKSDSSED
ncbi:c-type cytochrome [Halalkalibaculum sp. DA3122]|uniref:c-type cytochrome n=1 Tax=Halalkalibaculum sp. DA3122 TaxID=3373607 RepID=UPI003754FA8E